MSLPIQPFIKPIHQLQDVLYDITHGSDTETYLSNIFFLTMDCNLSFYSTVLFKCKPGVIQFCIKNNLLVSSLLVIGRYEMLVTRLLLDDAVSSSFSSFRLLLLLYAMSEVMGRLRSRLSFNLLTTYRTDGSVSVLCEKHLVFPPYDFR